MIRRRAEAASPGKNYLYHLLVFSIIDLTNEVARGYTKAGHQGNPDDARAARILLKDFVNGKILYCHPPPGVSPEKFNKDHYTPTPIAPKSLNPNAPSMVDDRAEMDERFFREDGPKAMTRNGVFGGRNLQYGFQKSVSDDGRVLTRKERKLREEMGVGPDARGKKHFKGRGKK
jgi:large subunit GTPase 1